MSVYLGKDKVGVAYLKLANMYEDNRSIMQDDIYTPWTRPDGWPDLDSLNLEMSGTESFIYMTFRTGHIDDVLSCGWTLVSGQSITIEEGTISNGIFSGTTLLTATSNSTFTKWFTSANSYNEGTIVIKVSGRFSKFYLADVTRSAADGGGTIKYYMLPMLERIWYVPELTLFYNGSSTNTTGSGTCSIERDKFANGTGEALTNMTNAWNWCYQLLSLDINGLKTQNVTTMNSAFYYCKRLEYLDVSHFDTSKVTSIGSMFYYCQRVRLLDLSNWDTTKLTGGGLSYTFGNCQCLLQILGLEKIYTNNLTTFSNVFTACFALEDLSGVAYWNTSKVTNLSSTFSNCYKIKNLDLSRWDVSKVTTIYGLFTSCISLEHIQFPLVKTATLTGSQYGIFYLCYNLQEVDLSWFSPITNAVNNIGYMFYHCRSLLEINIPEGWDITSCTAADSCRGMFTYCYKLLRITGISNWDMSNYNYSLNYLFLANYNLKELNISNWCPHPTGVYQMFESCYSLEEIDLTGWHWENLTGTGLSSLFSQCNSLKTIKGIEHAGDSSNLTSFGAIFNACYSLISLPDISSWNPANVTTCADMFNNCRSLRSLTIKNWSLPKCTNITNMFRYCYNMEELDLSGWSLPALTTNPDYIFCSMFSLVKCSGLPIKLNHRYQDDNSLPEDLWARIFTQLPTVSNKTLNMTTANINKLTSTTKAIATNKGWTLSN